MFNPILNCVLGTEETGTILRRTIRIPLIHLYKYVRYRSITYLAAENINSFSSLVPWHILRKEELKGKK